MSRVPPTLTLSVAAFLALGIPACVKHGKHTQEGVDIAQAKYQKLKAAADYDLATQQFTSGNLDLALESVDRSLTNYDEVPMAHVLRGRILLEKGLSMPAMESFDTAAKLSPDDPEVDYYKGILLERIGEHDAALARYQAALARDGDNAKYGLVTAETLLDLGRIPEARFLLNSASGDAAAQPGYRQLLGHIDLIENRIDDAAKHFEEAVALDPSDPSLLEDLARVQVRRREFAAAEAALAKVLSTPPSETRRDLQLLRASCLIELRRPVEARTMLLALVRDETQAEDVEVLIKLVDAAAMLEDDGTLRFASQRLMALAPQRPEGFLALAFAQRQSGELEAALSSANEALIRKPGNHAAITLKRLIEKQIAKG